MKRLKVLISAYACRPGMGSEPGVGWNVVNAIARYHDVWVLTRSDNQPTIEAALAANPIHGCTFLYVDLPGVSFWKRGLGMVHVHYYLWQLKAYQVARPLHQTVGLDIIHHVTYVRHSAPSFLALLPIPFIWGPVGGGEGTPHAFWREFHLRGKIYEWLRDGLRFIGEWDPFVRMTAQRSRIAYATTEATADRLKSMGCQSVKVLSQVGLSPEELFSLEADSSAQPAGIRFISIGRLLHWKGFHLGLQAFAQAKLPSTAEYWIVGKGPEETTLKTFARKLGIAFQIHFIREIPRPQLLSHLKTCRALIHPSLHESGGFVCLEAMAAGCPVICLDLGGPAIQVTPETGFKIRAHTPQQAITDLATALTRLAQEPDLQQQLGQAGRLHVQEFYRWETKATLFSQAYQEAIT